MTHEIHRYSTKSCRLTEYRCFFVTFCRDKQLLCLLLTNYWLLFLALLLSTTILTPLFKARDSADHRSNELWNLFLSWISYQMVNYYFSGHFLYFRIHTILNYGIELKSESENEVAQSCPTLCDPVDCSLPGSSVLEWGAISFSRSSRPRDWTLISPCCMQMLYCLSHQESSHSSFIRWSCFGSHLGKWCGLQDI